MIWDTYLRLNKQIWLGHSCWKETSIRKWLLYINYISNAVSITPISKKLIPGPIDFLGLNDFTIWVDSVSVTKINTFLSLLDTSNEGAGKTPPAKHKRYLHNTMWFHDTAELNNGSLLFKKRHVCVHIVLRRNSIQNDIASESVGLNLLFIFGNNKDFCSFCLGHSFLLRTCRDGHYLVAHGLCQFYTHRT